MEIAMMTGTSGRIEQTIETRGTRRIPIGGALTVAILAASALAGCSGGVSKRQIADAINEHLKEKACFALQEKKVPNWPMRVRRQMGLMSGKELDPILVAMQAAGYLKIAQETQREGFALMPVTVDVITPTEQAKAWWGLKEGFCVGMRAVADVQEWTEPGKDSGMPLQVRFTWHLTDVPSWAKRVEFKDIPGMTTPVPGMTFLQKTNNGWKSIL